MLVYTMNIEALIKLLAERGKFVTLTCVPLAGGGFKASIGQPDSIQVEDTATATGAKLNWALANLAVECERILAEEA